jgi:hypothetical protein
LFKIDSIEKIYINRGSFEEGESVDKQRGQYRLKEYKTTTKGEEAALPP